MKGLHLKTIVTWFGTHKKICIGIACALITVAGSSIWFLQRKPYKIIEKEKVVELGDALSLEPKDYVEADEDVLEVMSIDGSQVSTEVVGNYELKITYQEEVEVIQISVKDTTPPALVLKGSETDVYMGKSLHMGDMVETVSDLSEVTLSFDEKEEKTELVFTESKDKRVSIYAKDAYGNQSQQTFTLHVLEDIEAPEFDGIENTSIRLKQSFDSMAGVSATDNADGDVSDKISVSGSVNNQSAGTYELTYTVADEAGNEASATRSITVKDIVLEIQENNDISCSEDEKTKAILNAVLEYAGSNVSKMGIVYYDINSGNSFSINGNRQFRSASTAKLFAVMYASEQIANGSASASTMISYNADSDYEGGTGILQFEDKSQPIALSRLMTLAMTHSDNIAFHMIMNHFGVGQVLSYYESIIGHTTNRSITHMSAMDAKSLLLHAYSSSTFSGMLNDLKHTIFNDRISRYLPSGITAHKIGNYGGNVHDVGIVYANQPYILTVYSYGLGSPNEIEAKISKIIYDMQ